MGSLVVQLKDFTAEDRTRQACSRSYTSSYLATGLVAQDIVVIAFVHSILIRSCKGSESIASPSGVIAAGNAKSRHTVLYPGIATVLS